MVLDKWKYTAETNSISEIYSTIRNITNPTFQHHYYSVDLNICIFKPRKII